MNLKYKVPVIFFVFLVIITLYMIKSKHSLKSDIYANETTGKLWLIIWDWKLNFSSNYQPGLPFSHKTDQNWNLNFSKNYQPGLPSSQKSGQKLEPYSVCNTNLPAVNKLQDVRKYGQVESIPSKEELEGATADQLVSLYHSYLDNIDYLCQWKFRMGKIGDGGWEICDDVEYRPIQPCTIFSFGINYDFSFDDEASELYGCLVYSFDHSMANTEMHKHSKNVFFYKIGIRGENDFNRTDHSEIMTFSALRAMLHHSQIIDVVKMDVEGSEWESLTLMAKEGQLQSIRQLLIEYHFWDRITDCKALIYRLNVLRLVEDHGFRRFHVHKGPVCRSRIGNIPVEGTYCYGIHYVNSLLKRPK